MSSAREQRKAAVAAKYNLPDSEIRDQVTISQLLYKQIERCNQAGSGADDSNFDGCTDILFQNVPTAVRAAVVRRVSEYKVKTEKPVFKYNAGVPMGTIDHPVRLPTGEIWSPIMENTEFIDYRTLFNIIMQELENAKITWRYDNMTIELGKVDMPIIEIPLQTLELARKYLKQLIENDKKTGEEYAKSPDPNAAFYELCRQITPTIPPPTPHFADTGADFDVDDTEEELVPTEDKEPLVEPNVVEGEEEETEEGETNEQNK